MKKSNILFPIIGASFVFLFSKNKKTVESVIKKFEGFREYLYDDQAGNYTIGYGHKVDMDKNPILRVSKEQANRILAQDIDIAQGSIFELVKVPLSENQLIALTSFVFNIGIEAFSNSTLLNLLNQGKYLDAAKEFDRWQMITIDDIKVSSPELVKRRRDEMDIFIS